MGWCSGTNVFDEICNGILDYEELDESQQDYVVRIVFDALRGADWDCEFDSKFINHPIYRKILKDVYLDWDEED